VFGLLLQLLPQMRTTLALYGLSEGTTSIGDWLLLCSWVPR
jgi:hypothetical protein